MDSKRLDLYQLENGYCYNSDSLFLYSFIKRFLKNNVKLLDIGTGCGILGLLCARDFKIKLSLNEIDDTMAKIALINAKNNGIACDMIFGNILESSLESSGEKFDFIISNPPFYRKDIIDSKNKFLFLARQSKNLPLYLLLKFVKSILKPNGTFIFCYDAKEIKNVFSAISDTNFNVDEMAFVYPKISKNANLVMIKCKVSNSQTKILAPLYNFIDKEHSNEAKEIFRLCNTFSTKISNLEQIL